MQRLSWLLWLLIALMPVRGIAQSLMSVAPAESSPAVVVASATDAMPCPMHVGAGDAAANADTLSTGSDGSTGTSHACSLCNVCHAVMLPLTTGEPPASALPEAEPVHAHGLGAGRAAPAELFRPPR